MSSIPTADPRPFPVRSVLLVDPEQSLEDIFLTGFRPGEWVIQRVADNLAALEASRGRPFDLILTSAKSSGQDDVLLLRKLRLVRPHTRMIILAHESTPQVVIASMRERAFSYFSKPYEPDALREMIRLAVEGPTWDDGIEVISATPEWIRIMARCELKTADRLMQFFLEASELPEQEKNDVALASREILLNAIEHGGHMDPNKYLEISYVRGKHMVMCRVKDPGDGFTLDEIPHAAVANPLDDPIHHVTYRQEHGMRPGGFGVLLAQKLVDELIYNQHGNEVLLVKYLPPGPPKKMPD